SRVTRVANYTIPQQDGHREDSDPVAMGAGSRGSVVVDDVDVLDAVRIARRNGDEEGRALAERRLDADLAAEDPGQPERQREPEPGAAELAVALAPELDPLLERALLVLVRQTRARVLHVEADGVAVLARVRGDVDVPGLGELQRVDDEVPQDLGQLE